MIVRFLANALALALATWLLPGIVLETRDPVRAVLSIACVAAIFGLVNSLVKPLFKFVSTPLALVALGLCLLVVNAGLLMLTSWVCSKIGVAWHVDGFLSALLGGLLVSVVSFVGNSLFGRRGQEHE